LTQRLAGPAALLRPGLLPGQDSAPIPVPLNGFV